MKIELLEDRRLRLPGDHVLVGDHADMADGTRGRVVAFRREGDRYFLVVVPEEVCRSVFGPTWPYHRPTDPW